MQVPLKPDVIRLSNGQAVLYTVPWIDVSLTSNHKVGPSISCYIDTGATVTIFPSGYARGFLGYSETSLVFFVDNQPFPLLGRIGFMDKFKKIIFDEENKVLEFVK